MKKEINVVAVVVTYNRKNLLIECLFSILNQTKSISKLLIIDNASTDGTENLLKEKGLLRKENVYYHKMKFNTGGAGGFYTGLNMIKNMNDIDWVWIMDDDTIPEKECLENLIKAVNIEENSSFFASCVRGINNEPMNVPFIDEKIGENGYPDWYMKLNYSLVKISKATFVSLLIKKDAILKCGLPCKEYFIWGDDFEYTTRLTKYYAPAYLVGTSWVCHKRFSAKSVSIENETSKNRIRNYYYAYRNAMINKYLYEGHIGYLKQLIKYFLFSFKMLKEKSGVTKFFIIHKGLISSAHKKKHIKKIINEQVKIGGE